MIWRNLTEWNTAKWSFRFLLVFLLCRVLLVLHQCRVPPLYVASRVRPVLTDRRFLPVNLGGHASLTNDLTRYGSGAVPRATRAKGVLTFTAIFSPVYEVEDLVALSVNFGVMTVDYQ